MRAVFGSESEMLGCADQQWMINFRVHDLDAMVSQLRAAGLRSRSTRKNTRKAGSPQLKNPDGNPIQLWQPS